MKKNQHILIDINHTVKPPKGFHILMADDDDDDKYLLASAFKDIGLTIPLKYFNDGTQLLDHLLLPDNSSEVPALILLDLNMPKQDGKASLKIIKTIPYLVNTPVVVYSTSKANKDISDTYNLGCNAYIVKPNCYEEIKRVAKGIKNLWIDSYMSAFPLYPKIRAI